jgi:ABC-2 type transport system permease protein
MTDATTRARRIAGLDFERVGHSGGGTASGFLRAAQEVLRRRELLGLLVRRELKARYKDSSLGFLWSLIRPITMLAIYWVAIGQFLGAARGVPDFGVFVFAGITIWGLYSEIVSAGTISVLSNAGLIKKVYLPREIFPLASVGSALFNFAVQFLVLIAGVVAFAHVRVDWTLLYVPVAIVIATIYGLAVAILLSAVNVYLRDVQYLVEVGLMIFFWASPIVYAWSFVTDAARELAMPWIEQVYLLNPMSIVIIAFQRGIWASGSETVTLGERVVGPQPWPADLDLRLLVVGILGLVFVWFAQRVFARLQGNFAQEI